MGVLRRVAIVVGYVVLVAAIATVIVLAHLGAQQHRCTQEVTNFSILIDGTEGHNLIDEAAMHRWFKAHGVHPDGLTLDEVNLAELESVAMEHSAVSRANAYMTHAGYVEMNIVQREPIMRFKVDGYDHYVARDGHIFKAMGGYAAYVPVVTGNYKPLFTRDFAGSFDEFIEDSIASMHREIGHCEQLKYPIYRDKNKANSRLKSVRDSVIYKSWFMSEEKHAALVANLELFKEAFAKRKTEEIGKYDKQLASLEKRQERLYDNITAVNKRKGDFENLEKFVSYILRDSFWGAEITQVIISESRAGDMLIKLVPRSGGFVIDFGEVERIEDKFNALSRFYSSVLRSVGWDAYREISVRYDGQVVCREAIKRDGDNSNNNKS